MFEGEENHQAQKRGWSYWLRYVTPDGYSSCTALASARRRSRPRPKGLRHRCWPAPVTLRARFAWRTRCVLA